jgi:hypothetical protein
VLRAFLIDLGPAEDRRLAGEIQLLLWAHVGAADEPAEH